MHEREIIHTNMNPETIFLRNSDINQMCFLNLFHCSWNTSETLKNKGIDEDFEDNISLFDIRTRSQEFISPEQLQLGKELADIVFPRNGKIDESQHEIQDFMNSNFSQKKAKINSKCDIYALGAIMYKLLIGKAPNHKVSKYISEKQFHMNVP